MNFSKYFLPLLLLPATLLAAEEPQVVRLWPNGAAVLICPGGGHRELVFKAEGVEAAQYSNNLGVAAFVLK
jgi:hypothetical protein